MELLMDVLRLLVSILIAFLAGNLIAKGKLPSILGWLIAGMLLGPYALGLLGNGILDARWFEMLKSVFECTFGLMIGTELIWKKMRRIPHAYTSTYSLPRTCTTLWNNLE